MGSALTVKNYEYPADRRLAGGFLADTSYESTPVVCVTHYGHRINLDGGTGYGRAVGVVVFEGRTCWEGLILFWHMNFFLHAVIT